MLFYGNIIFAQQSAELGTISPPKANSIGRTKIVIRQNRLFLSQQLDSAKHVAMLAITTPIGKNANVSTKIIGGKITAAIGVNKTLMGSGTQTQ